ncbi:MAG: ATP-dependent DNA ligase [Bacteroidota bacterium]|nr:ATP-dependent DNA ligase [Bacteroidota bacterium]
MKDFAQLYYDLDQTNKTNDKVEILKEYFLNANEEDKKWALALFIGKRPKRIISSTLLREYAAEFSGIPLWLFEESYSIVGDLSETISLLLPPPTQAESYSLSYWIGLMQSMGKKSIDERKEAMIQAWDTMNSQERMVFSKITSSTFRVGVSQNLVIRALSQAYHIDGNVIAHRLMGNWNPNEISFDELILSHNNKDLLSRPYPFCLAYPIEKQVNELGQATKWVAEWKWDGIRSQIIKRAGQLFIWSRGEELITDKFPELQTLLNIIPDGTVIDGEILPYSEGKVLTFNVLQTRIGRKNLNPKILREAPVIVYAYDLLEWDNEDIRGKTLADRQALLNTLVNGLDQNAQIQLPPSIYFNDWDELPAIRTKSRAYMAEGLMLKRKESIYQVGRKKGDWWKWKIDPLSIDAVMIYAQRGSGRRANLYTDYTFAVKNGEEFVPFTKAYSGLTDKEILEVDKWIKFHTKEKFGPVRTVDPQLVFEIGFEGIQKSSRHKSGIALRFPRMLRWRTDKVVNDINTLEDLQQMLAQYEKGL